MPYLPKDEEDQYWALKQPDDAISGSVRTGQPTAHEQAPATGGGSAAPTDFVNFDRYVAANPGAAAQANTTVGAVGDKLNDAQGAVGSAMNRFGNDVAKGTPGYQPVGQQNVSGQVGAPTANRPQAGAPAPANGQINFLTGEGVKNERASTIGPGGYTGPSSLLDAQYNVDKIRDMGHEGQDMARAGTTEGGRSALMDKLYGQSMAGAGGSALDSALLGYHAGGKFGALQDQYKGFDKLLNGNVRTSQTIGDQSRATAQKAQDDFKAWADARTKEDADRANAGAVAKQQHDKFLEAQNRGAGGVLQDVLHGMSIFAPAYEMATGKRDPISRAAQDNVQGWKNTYNWGPEQEDVYNSMTPAELEEFNNMSYQKQLDFIQNRKLMLHGGQP